MSLLNGTQKIVMVRGHYEAHTVNGEFISSGSTWEECYDDLKEMIKAEAEMLQSISV